MTLTEFLLARIAEDEAAARDVGPRDFGPRDLMARHHAARWRPARVLAECEAKRRIVETRPFKLLGSGEERQADRLRDHVCRLLASVYADHPDYRPEWRP